MKFIIFISFLLTTNILFAQANFFLLKGELTSNDKTFIGGELSIERDDGIIQHVILDENSKFNLPLEYGSDYMVSVLKEGYYSKKVLIELKTVDSVHKNCKARNVIVSMIPIGKDIEESIFEKPIGRIFYDSKTQCFDWAILEMDLIKKFE